MTRTVDQPPTPAGTSSAVAQEAAVTAAPSDPSHAGIHRWRWIGLVVILAAEVTDLIDALVTTVAAPAIQRDIGGTATLVQWLGAAYMAVGLLTGGRLGDLYGRRRVFVVGAVGFTTSSLLCALAQTPEALIGFRAAQGAFAAGVDAPAYGASGSSWSPSPTPPSSTISRRCRSSLPE